ncbi:hypothetical protein D3C86_1373160 [compost metagenome]
MRFFDGYAMAFGGVPLPEFFLNLDEETGCYAVAQYNTFESDRNRRIQVVHYNNSNKEIARAYYQSPKNKYKYMEFLDLATIGSKEVVVSVLGRNTVASGGDKAGILLMGSLKAGAKAFDMQKVNYNAGRPSKIKAALTRYNPHTGDIYLLTLESAGQKKSMMQFRSQLSIIDADWHINSRMVTTKKIQDLTKKHYKKENTFLAVPQNLYVNKDGGFSVLFEEQKIVTTNTSTGSGSGFSTKTRTTCTMGDIGVQRYDREGNEQSVYYIPKSHYYGTLIPDYMYNAKVQQCGVRLHWGYQFKSFAYVPVGERGYVLFNDIERNAKKVEKKREVSTVSAAGDLEAFVFDLNEQNAVPVRKQIFAAEGKNDRSLGLFNGSNYNAAHKLMTVVVTQPRTKDARNNTKVVWLSVD